MALKGIWRKWSVFSQVVSGPCNIVLKWSVFSHRPHLPGRYLVTDLPQGRCGRWWSVESVFRHIPGLIPFKKIYEFSSEVKKTCKGVFESRSFISICEIKAVFFGTTILMTLDSPSSW